MLRLLPAALAVYSYFEIRTSLPLLTARIPTHGGATAPVGQVISIHVWLSLFLQIFLSGVLLAVPYFPQAAHFGSRSLRDYTPEQLDRIMPLLRQMTGRMSLLVSSYFAFCIRLRIHGALSQGPVLPADWLARVTRTELEWMVGLLVGCGIIVHRYFARFDEVAAQV
jgi:hypothetical protein